METIIYPVKDIEAAKQLYGRAFGVEPYVDEPYYVAFNVGGQDVGLDPNGHGKGMTGPVPYWKVDDIEATLAALVETGCETQQPVSSVGPGRRIATVRDADGNPIGLLQDSPGGPAA
jgi:predicted enzyme related to lactoylglutathione lyase